MLFTLESAGKDWSDWKSNVVERIEIYLRFSTKGAGLIPENSGNACRVSGEGSG